MDYFSILPAEFRRHLMISFGHSLWQGLVIASGAALAAWLLRRREPNLRYGVYLSALVLLVICLPVTYMLVAQAHIGRTQNSSENRLTQSSNHVTDRRFGDVRHEPVGTGGASLNQQPTVSLPSNVVAANEATDIRWRGLSELLSWIYLAGVLLMLARLCISLVGAQRLCQDTEPIESPTVLKAIEDLVCELGLLAAPTLALSRRVVAPTVIGIIRPTILLPFSFATALSPDELSSILAHELVHIRRHDLWINLFQRFVEALLFFHPAVWFLSRHLSTEREYYCDDVAASRGLGSIRYAELLVWLAEVRCRMPSAVEHQVALAAAGDRPSQLRRRIARLFGLEEELSMRITLRSAMTLVATFVMAAALFTASVPAESPDVAARQDAKEKLANDRVATLAESADAGQPLFDSKLSESERALLGTWERVGFLNQTKLSFTAERSYQYEYSIPGAKQQSGEWKIENGTELVYLARKADGTAEETLRSRIVAINEKELKLQQLSPADHNQVVAFTRVPAVAKQSQHRVATISGRIVFEDGSAGKHKGWLYSQSSDGRASIFCTAGQCTDRFFIEVRPGTVWLKYFVDEYAPAWLGPIEVQEGDTVDGVRIVVKEGHWSTLRVEDEDKHPLAGATLVALPAIGGNTNGPRVELTTDPQGEVTLKHVAEVPYAFRVEAAGYEPLSTAPRQLASKTSTLKLTRSQPTTGTVLNADGTAASNASLRLLREVAPDGDVSKSRSGRVMATTDASGRFSLDQLTAQARHVFLVRAADGARLVARDLSAGQSDVLIEVPRRRDLRVRIVGDLSRLPKRSGNPYVMVRQDVEDGADSRPLSIGEVVFVTLTEEGGVAEYRGLVSGEVIVRTGNQSQTSKVADSGTTEILLNLGGTNTEMNTEEKADLGLGREASAATPIPLGEIVELTVNDDNRKVGGFMIDFETGRLFSIPEEYREGRTGPPPLFEKWIVPNGIDAMGETKGSVKGLLGFDMVAIPMDGPADQLPEISEARLSSQFVDSVPGRPVPIRGKGELPATYLFQTREGTRGLLQIVGFAEQPRGVKIRYKLLSRK